MMTGSAKSKYGDVLMSSGVDPSGGGKFSMMRVTLVWVMLSNFVVRDGAGCVGDGLSYEKVGSNFNEGGEFVYMCGSELCHGGENVESGLRVEPVLVEECLKKEINCGVRVKTEGGFKVGAPRVVNEGGKVLEVKCDLYCPRTISCSKRCALKVPTGNFDVV